MVVELSAVRLLAPWFGSSSAVWTNVIGVVLLALALGYLIGARLSSSGDTLARLGACLCIAGAVAVYLPAAARPVAELFRPTGVSLDRAVELLVWGSLACSVLLFLPAALCLGCVGPLAVEELARGDGCRAGSAGGRVLAASTLGSLAGTFGTTHVFLPELGVRWTLVLAAVTLALPGLVISWHARRRALAAATIVLVGLGAGSSRWEQPPAGEGWTLLEQGNSTYQNARVVESDDGWRQLQVNESLDSFQSVWTPEPGLLGLGFYYDLFALPAWWDQAPAAPRPAAWRLCVLGLGGGTTWRVLAGALPEGRELAGLGIEIDPLVLGLGERWMDLETSESLVAARGDARALMNAGGGTYDQIVLDTYENNMEIPPHLCTEEFFAEARERLREGGWLSANVGGFGFDDPVVTSLARTMSAGLAARVLILRVPFSRNFVLMARRGEQPHEPGSARFRSVGDGLTPLAARLELPGAWRWAEAGEGELLTDDRNPIDQLQLASVRRAQQRLRGAETEP